MSLGRGVYRKHKCPEKGCKEKFRTIVALGTHRAKFHHIAGAWNEAMQEARRKGLFENHTNSGTRKKKLPAAALSKKEQDAIDRAWAAELQHRAEGGTHESENSEQGFDPAEIGFHETAKPNGHSVSTVQNLTWYAFGHIQGWIAQCAGVNGVSEAVLAAGVAELLRAQSGREGFLGNSHSLSELRQDASA
jgi:hypothetical protein